MVLGCLGAREGGGVPLHQPPPPAPPQPGGRHGQAGARATQQVREQKYLKFWKIIYTSCLRQEGADAWTEQGGIRGVPRLPAGGVCNI